MSPVDTKPTGRVSFDERGQAIWEWEIAPGVFSREVGTGRFPGIDAGSGLSLEESGDDVSARGRAGKPGAVGDPRNSDGSDISVGDRPRKSLDDLRRLSEQIKRTRNWQPPAKKER